MLSKYLLKALGQIQYIFRLKIGLNNPGIVNL